MKPNDFATSYRLRRRIPCHSRVADEHQRLFLPHPVPDSNIITWLNLKGKLCFDLLQKKILLWGSGTWLTPFRRRYMGLPWQQRDFLPMPIRQLQHSICGHLKRTAPPQVIPEKSPPTLNKYLDTWTVPLCRLWCYSVKNTLLNKFSLPLQAVRQSGAMALTLLPIRIVSDRSIEHVCTFMSLIALNKWPIMPSATCIRNIKVLFLYSYLGSQSHWQHHCTVCFCWGFFIWGWGGERAQVQLSYLYVSLEAGLGVKRWLCRLTSAELLC